MGRWALPQGMQRRGKAVSHPAGGATVPGSVGLGGLGWAEAGRTCLPGHGVGAGRLGVLQADS